LKVNKSSRRSWTRLLSISLGPVFVATVLLIAIFPGPEVIAGSPDHVVTSMAAAGYYDDDDPHDFNTLPPGASLDPTTAVLTWTPTADQIGVWHIQVTATDSYGASASAEFDVSVYSQYDVNQDWTINILDLVAVGQAIGAPDPGNRDVNHDGTVNILDLIGVAQGV
jgi:hypothetical protein